MLCELCRWKAEEGFIEFDIEDDTYEAQHFVLCVDCFNRCKFTDPLKNVKLHIPGRYKKKDNG